MHATFEQQKIQFCFFEMQKANVRKRHEAKESIDTKCALKMISCMRRDLLRYKLVIGKSLSTEGVYFVSKLEKKTNFVLSEIYGSNYDTDLCNPLSQHSIRAFILI